MASRNSGRCSDRRFSWFARRSARGHDWSAGGALFGASADLVHRGAGREFVEKVSRELLPGKAAIVAEVSNGKVSDLNTEMGAIGGVVLRE